MGYHSTVNFFVKGSIFLAPAVSRVAAYYVYMGLCIWGKVRRPVVAGPRLGRLVVDACEIKHIYPAVGPRLGRLVVDACEIKYIYPAASTPNGLWQLFRIKIPPIKKNRENFVRTAIATNTTTTTLQCLVLVPSKERQLIAPLRPPKTRQSRQMHHPLALLHRKSDW